MTLILTESQRDYLRSEPIPQGDSNKIRMALRLRDANQQALATALATTRARVSFYINGGDLLASTMFRIAEVFGLANPCDLWPSPPMAKRTNARRSKAVKKAQRAADAKVKAPKAMAA